MSLNSSTLASLIKSSVNNIDFENGEISNDAIIEAIADAIVSHITSDAQVIIAGGSSSGTYGVN